MTMPIPATTLLAAPDANLLTVYIYKLVVVLLGAGSILLGYRLFMKGFTAPAGDIDVSDGTRKLQMAKVAPGIFFALFGAVVIVVGVSRPIQFQSGDGSEMTTPAQDRSATPPPPTAEHDTAAATPGTTPPAPRQDPPAVICDTCATRHHVPASAVARHPVVLCDTCSN